MPERPPFIDPHPMWEGHKKPEVWSALAPRLAKIREALSDEESKAHLDCVLKFYETFDVGHLKPNPKARGHYGYDAARLPVLGKDHLVVDCGAYIGDTFPEYGEAQIVAIEPGVINAQKIAGTYAGDIARGRIEVVVAAAGAALGTTTLTTNPKKPDSRAVTGFGGEPVPVTTIDRVLNSRKPNVIKIDCEGADMDALRGARNTLGAFRPIVAACGYHKPEHMAEVPEYLMDVLGPCDLYASNDPHWHFHTHFIAVPI